MNAIATSKTIGVFFGSRSPEHDVSIITAQLIISGLQKIGYETVPVYIDKDGKWHIAPELESLSFFKQRDRERRLASFPTYSLNINESRGKIVLERGRLSKKQLVIDIAFPAFHGPHGEDGTAQGLFELLNVPYVGCSSATSALAMDKVLTKLLYQQFGVPTSEFMYFTAREWADEKKGILAGLKTLGRNVFVKPARAGSSIGITKVDTVSELEFAIDVALKFDSKVIVEKAISNVADLTVCVLGNASDQKRPQASLVQESKFSEGFFTYDEKYLKEGGAQLGKAKEAIIIPAEVPEDVLLEAQKMALEVFDAFECSGIARVDFLYNKTNRQLYANEINPMPGTLYHHLWRESGVDLDTLLSRLILLAERRHKEKGLIHYTFESPILENADTNKLAAKLQPRDEGVKKPEKEEEETRRGKQR